MSSTKRYTLSMPASNKDKKRMRLALERVLKDEERELTSATNTEEKQKPKKGKAETTGTYVSTRPIERRRRVLVMCSRGVTDRFRHLMLDMRKLIPHAKSESKFDKKDTLAAINELCEMQSCNLAVYFEARKHKDLYAWFGGAPHGPSAKFHVVNIHTMEELKLTGNGLVGARPLLHFDAAFNSPASPHLAILKELFTQVFSTPKLHPKSKPFVDRIICFFVADNKIWFRNYQIVWPSRDNTLQEHKLIEIGPRFVLIPVRIFAGGFGGPTLYRNQDYKTPNEMRRALRTNGSDYGDAQEDKKKALAHARKILDRRPIDRLEGHMLFKQAVDADKELGKWLDSESAKAKHNDNDDDESQEEEERTTDPMSDDDEEDSY